MSLTTGLFDDPDLFQLAADIWRLFRRTDDPQAFQEALAAGDHERAYAMLDRPDGVITSLRETSRALAARYPDVLEEPSGALFGSDLTAYGKRSETDLMLAPLYGAVCAIKCVGSGDGSRGSTNPERGNRAFFSDLGTRMEAIGLRPQGRSQASRTSPASISCGNCVGDTHLVSRDGDLCCVQCGNQLA